MSEMFGGFLFGLGFFISYGTGFNIMFSIFIASLLRGLKTSPSHWQLKTGNNVPL